MGAAGGGRTAPYSGKASDAPGDSAVPDIGAHASAMALIAARTRRLRNDRESGTSRNEFAWC
jgi:hypothetical protein